MTVYNSQRVNNDPEPYVVYVDHRRTDERHYRHVDFTSYEGEDVNSTYEPRPEYDNNPNPYLTYIRNSKSLTETPLENYLSWLESEPSQVLWCSGKDSIDEALPLIKHAHKVLTKLVNVYGPEMKEEQK